VILVDDFGSGSLCRKYKKPIMITFTVFLLLYQTVENDNDWLVVLNYIKVPKRLQGNFWQRKKWQLMEEQVLYLPEQ